MASNELAAKLARRNQLNELGERQPLQPIETPDSNALTATASDELASKLQRRQQINEGVISGGAMRNDTEMTILKDFSEFSIKEISVIS